MKIPKFAAINPNPVQMPQFGMQLRDPERERAAAAGSAQPANPFAALTAPAVSGVQAISGRSAQQAAMQFAGDELTRFKAAQPNVNLMQPTRLAENLGTQFQAFA